jgi:hypothetical protein
MNMLLKDLTTLQTLHYTAANYSQCYRRVREKIQIILLCISLNIHHMEKYFKLNFILTSSIFQGVYQFLAMKRFVKYDAHTCIFK